MQRFGKVLFKNSRNTRWECTGVPSATATYSFAYANPYFISKVGGRFEEIYDILSPIKNIIKEERTETFNYHLSIFGSLGQPVGDTDSKTFRGCSKIVALRAFNSNIPFIYVPAAVTSRNTKVKSEVTGVTMGKLITLKLVTARDKLVTEVAKV